MQTPKSDNDRDPRHHTANIINMLNNVKTHVREDASKVEDAQAKALFEVTAEVLQGLITAYEHYEGQTEKAWK